MHPTTAKILRLDKIESLVAYGWPKGAVPKLADEARTLRQEIPRPILERYDHLRIERKDPVVPVLDEVCQGCRAHLSQAALAKLEGGDEVACCERCGRFVFASESHLADHEQLPLSLEGKSISVH